MRICSHCGMQNADGAQFCRGCGQSLLSSSSPTMTPTQNSYLGSKPKPESGLFKNAGPKLKGMAIVIFVLTLIIGEVIGIALVKRGIFTENDIPIIIGVILILITPLVAWLSAIMLYAFGELCENVSIISTIQQQK